VVGSAAVLPDKAVVAATASALFRVSAAGEVEWQVPLPAPAVGQAGPTVRLGGTVLLGVTDRVLHVAPDGAVLWEAPVGGAPIEASPAVDPVGRIYVLASGAVTRLDAAGAVVWSSPLPLGVTSLGHPAVSPTGAIVHATSDGGLRALDPETGELQWSHDSGAATGTGALALGATGIAYYGTSAGVSAATLSGGDFATWAVSPAPLGVGVFNTAYQCCIPKDQAMVSTPQATGLFKRSANLATSIYQKAPGSAWHVATDYDGDTWVTSTAGSLVALDVSGNQKWTYKPAGATITTPPAVGPGLVVVGDSAGVLHGLGD
jgi:outer membrane protein assembly factor BamB